MPEGEAANVRPAAGSAFANLANQFADWAQMRTAANEGEEEEKKGGPDQLEEEKK